MILFHGNTKHIPTNIKLPVLLIILWITYTNIIINHALYYNFGIPYLPLQKFIFIVIPFFYAINQILKQKRVMAPHFIIFIVTLISFLLIELHHTKNFETSELNILNRWLLIYLFFFMILNLTRGITNFSFIIEYFVIAALINTFIIELAAFGFINFPLHYSIDSQRIGASFNLNAVADSNAFAISVLIIILLIPQYFNRIKKNNLIIISIALISLLVLTATRGSLLIITFTVIFYLIYKYLSKNIVQQLIISIFVFIIFVLFFDIISDKISQLVITKRVGNTSLYEEGRGMQILATWYNFSNNPWFGVGYKDAAYGIYQGIVQSKFQYTQILASSGIFFFILFIFFLFKILAGKFLML